MKRASQSSGFALFETLISVGLFVIVFLSAVAMMDSGRRLSRTTLEISVVEDLAQQMLFRIERELANATGAEPRTVVAGQDLTAGETARLQVSSTVGFPPFGRLVLEPGSPNEEILSYGSIDATESFFQNLARGESCSDPAVHGLLRDVLWAGLAEPIENQDNPGPGEFDGTSSEFGRPIFFRGLGTGFSFRIPVDPTGGSNFLNGDDLNWGAEINGVQTTDGWKALYFLPKTEYVEAVTNEDVNRDGDSLDVFDIGQIRMLSWDRTDPGRRVDIGLGPSAILQEQCNWGSDLDGDQFDDPIFLWNKDTNELHIRLFYIGLTQRDAPIVRQVHSTTFLRNEPELD